MGEAWGDKQWRKWGVMGGKKRGGGGKKGGLEKCQACHGIIYSSFCVTGSTKINTRNKNSNLSHTHSHTHTAPPMNLEATPVLGSARLETAASAVRCALLTPSVPFHRQQESRYKIKVLIAAFSRCFLTVRLLEPRKVISITSDKKKGNRTLL